MTPIMKALVAEATRIGTPHQAFRMGTLITPPPSPRSVEIVPAANDVTIARGMRVIR